MEQVSAILAFGGVQGLCKHASATTGNDMIFSVAVPPREEGAKLPAVWYLSGLTCTCANATEKGESRRACAELGLILIASDTSPRGDGVSDDAEGANDFGLGAGFYVDATKAPLDRNYRMRTYLIEELPALIAEHVPGDIECQAIVCHFMGGQGAITIALRHSNRFKAVSTFSPITAPSRIPWGSKALSGYLGDHRTHGASMTPLIDLLHPTNGSVSPSPRSWSHGTL